MSDWIYDISDRQARIFIEECIAGDGSWASNGHGNAAMLYGKKEFLDSVLILCIQKGINASISVFREKDWRINFNFKANSKSFATEYNKCKGNLYRKEYKGVMWCLETEYTNFVVRRRGIPYVTGNCFKLHEYTPYFRDIRGFGAFDGFALTHIPIHPDSLERWKGNIHGHLHSNRVMTTDYCHGDMFEVIDSRYLCVSMEHINYTPISWDEVKKRFEEQQ